MKYFSDYFLLSFLFYCLYNFISIVNVSKKLCMLLALSLQGLRYIALADYVAVQNALFCTQILIERNC